MGCWLFHSVTIESLLIDLKRMLYMKEKVNADSVYLQTTKYSRLHKRLIIGLGCFGILVIVLFVVVLFVFSSIRIRTGSIEITSAFLTTGLDEHRNPLPPTDHFPSGQSRIYCYVLFKLEK